MVQFSGVRSVYDHVLDRYKLDCSSIKSEEDAFKEYRAAPEFAEYGDDFLREQARAEVANAPNERVSACHDAVCNLLLFTRVLAKHNHEQHVVVAFGSQHI